MPPSRCASHSDTSAMPRTCAECGCIAPTCSHNLPQLLLCSALPKTCPRRSTVLLRLVPFTLAVPLFPPARVDVYAPAAEPYSVGSLAADAQRRKARAVGAAALGKGARRSERCTPVPGLHARMRQAHTDPAATFATMHASTGMQFKTRGPRLGSRCPSSATAVSALPQVPCCQTHVCVHAAAHRVDDA